MEEKNKIDWSVLRGAVILFTVCLVLCSLMIGTSYYFYDDASKKFTQSKNLFKSTSRRYLDVDQEEKLLRDHYPDFVKLYNRGVLGREKRLNWIEALRQAAEKLKIPKLNVDIKIKAVINDQLWKQQLQYWEGAMIVSGSHTGRGYLELSGY